MNAPLALVLIVALVLAVVGCGGGGDHPVDGTGAVRPAAQGNAKEQAREPATSEGRDAAGTPETGARSSRRAVRRGGAARPLPSGTTFDARDPGLPKAIQKLLNPPRSPDAPSAGGEDAQPRGPGLRGLVKDLLRGGRPRQADAGEATPDSGSAAGHAVVDQLR